MTKQICSLCGATRDTSILITTDEDIEKRLGPLLCTWPDGDGHIWHDVPDMPIIHLKQSVLTQDVLDNDLDMLDED